MNNPYLYPDEINVFEDKPLTFRVQNINEEGSNVKEVFEANLANYLYNTFYNTNDAKIKSSKEILDLYYKGQLQESALNWQKTSQCLGFVCFELENFANEQSPKKAVYNTFLNANKETYRLIDLLVRKYPYSDSVIHFPLFGESKINANIISLQEIGLEFDGLEEFIHDTLALELIHNLEFIKDKDYKEALNKVLDLEVFLNPVLLFEEEELQTYQKAIKAWYKNITLEFKKKLDVIETPPICDFILNQINEILELPDNEALKTLQKQEGEYPKFIFENHKAFLLFDTIAKEMTSHAQISFLFRQMSEIEKPILIVSENALFIKWFNDQDYKIKLEYTTKTFSQSKTDDRIILYRLVKNLIYKD